MVNKMKKCDEELFLLKGQRNSNEDDEKQRQNLFGLLRTQVVEQLDMTRERQMMNCMQALMRF